MAIPAGYNVIPLPPVGGQPRGDGAYAPAELVIDEGEY